ncbi:MAG: hypothetical protein HY296_08305 [Thaumarchaeota archaeon]|nr:hypothetical protein [Nitrososphaerota archaeon]
MSEKSSDTEAGADKRHEPENSVMFVECEIIHDSIGVTHFLPPKRCKNCDD